MILFTIEFVKTPVLKSIVAKIGDEKIRITRPRNLVWQNE
jgi:hypothetical protein